MTLPGVGTADVRVNYKKEVILRKALKMMSVWFPEKQILREDLNVSSLLGR